MYDKIRINLTVGMSCSFSGTGLSGVGVGDWDWVHQQILRFYIVLHSTHSTSIPDAAS